MNGLWVVIVMAALLLVLLLVILLPLALGLALLLGALIDRMAVEKLLDRAMKDVWDRLDRDALARPGLNWARSMTRTTLVIWGFVLVYGGLLLRLVCAGLVWVLTLPVRLICRRRPSDVG